MDGPRPAHVVADADDESDAVRGAIRRSGGRAGLRPNPTRRVKKRYDKARSRDRNVIERSFGRLKQFRRVATRYEKKAANFLGFVWLAAILITLKSMSTQS